VPHRDGGVLILFSPIEGVVREDGFCSIGPFFLVNHDDWPPLDQFAFQEFSDGKHPAPTSFDDSHAHPARVRIGGDWNDISIDDAKTTRSAAPAIEAAPVVPLRQHGTSAHVLLDRYLVVHDR